MTKDVEHFTTKDVGPFTRKDVGPILQWYLSFYRDIYRTDLRLELKANYDKFTTRAEETHVQLIL